MKKSKRCIFHRWGLGIAIYPVPMGPELAYARKNVWLARCEKCGKSKVYIK